MYGIATSPQFSELLSFLAIFIWLAAVGLFVFAVVEYRNDRFSKQEKKDDDPWVVIVETLRDSFLISVLYITIDYLRQTSALTTQNQPSELLLFFRIISPFLEVATLGLVALIVLRRLFELGRWLERRRKK